MVTANVDGSKRPAWAVAPLHHNYAITLVCPFMRYVSLDLETSGPHPQRHQVLELAAMIEDTRRLLTNLAQVMVSYMKKPTLY